MAKKPKRDLTREEQLARGPMDLPFLMLVCMLLGIGLIMLLSASSISAQYDKAANYNATYYFQHQLIYAIAGLVVMYFITRINYQTFRWMSIFILIAAYICLLLVFTPLGYGKATVGAQRWLKIGPINFQPSEIAKIGVILYFSARLSKRKDGPTQYRGGKLIFPLEQIRSLSRKSGFSELIPYGLILVSLAVLLLKEPHMSGTILVFVGGAAVLFASGIHMGWFVAGGGLAVGALGFMMTTMQHTSARLAVWRDPWTALADGNWSAYQVIQSLYAVASGGLMGLGLGQSRQKYLYLPEEQNDFIFAVVCEELGLIGACMVIVLFALLILRGYWIALHARDRFGSLVVVGITTLLAAQVFLNIAVITNLIPTTGISLPFFSYGGTALMIQLAEMGIILSISRQIPAPKQG
jgi:cell division protein FtsW